MQNEVSLDTERLNEVSERLTGGCSVIDVTNRGCARQNTAALEVLQRSTEMKHALKN